MPSKGIELLQTYRILCKLAKAIPSPAIREETWREIRQIYRDLYKRNQLEQLEEWSQSKLFWLKCTIPKQLWPRCVVDSSPKIDNVSKTFVFRNGKLEETMNSSPYEYKRTVDPDDLRRHHELLRRMRFGKVE
ncbi:hypothetical protein GpartN1_g3985.t1 [Galdieria partita]|uniref:Uncharacterized protein n=1 Tax=Galdieria partita TaxID=83374 RepID=A0A9C7PX71_9RHOD|nr:hypothetical protein GpartN1_g3985.t1 [Galdieria partita]